MKIIAFIIATILLPLSLAVEQEEREAWYYEKYERDTDDYRKKCTLVNVVEKEIKRYTLHDIKAKCPKGQKAVHYIIGLKPDPYEHEYPKEEYPMEGYSYGYGKGKYEPKCPDDHIEKCTVEDDCVSCKLHIRPLYKYKKDAKKCGKTVTACLWVLCCEEH